MFNAVIWLLKILLCCVDGQVKRLAFYHLEVNEGKIALEANLGRLTFRRSQKNVPTYIFHHVDCLVNQKSP